MPSAFVVKSVTALLFRLFADVKVAGLDNMDFESFLEVRAGHEYTFSCPLSLTHVKCVVRLAWICVQAADTKMADEFTAKEFQVSCQPGHWATGQCRPCNPFPPPWIVNYATGSCAVAGHDDWDDEVCGFEGKSRTWKAVSATGVCCCGRHACALLLRTDWLAVFHLMCRWGLGVSLGAISGLVVGASLRLRSGPGTTGKHSASYFAGFNNCSVWLC
jgi:hypothetical protein